MSDSHSHHIVTPVSTYVTIFVSLLATYFRSTNIELLFPHDTKNLVAESYDPLDAHGQASLQRLMPGGILGYGF